MKAYSTETDHPDFGTLTADVDYVKGHGTIKASARGGIDLTGFRIAHGRVVYDTLECMPTADFQRLGQMIQHDIAKGETDEDPTPA